MAEVLQSIIAFLGSVVALVVNLTNGVGQMLVMLPKALTMLNYGISFIPTPVFAFAYAVISISVAYLIIGR